MNMLLDITYPTFAVTKDDYKPFNAAVESSDKKMHEQRRSLRNAYLEMEEADDDDK